MRLRLRWIFTGLMISLLPKCLACVAGYLAVLGGLAATPELCGGGENGSRDGWLVAAWLLGLAVVGTVVSSIAKKHAQMSESDGANR